MNKKFLLQVLGLLIFVLLLIVSYSYYDYLSELQKHTFQIYTNQLTLSIFLTITPGTVCLFLPQIIEKVKLKDKSFDLKILIVYIAIVLVFVFAHYIYFFLSGVGGWFGAWIRKLTMYLHETRAIGAVLLGLGIVHALYLTKKPNKL
jgi:hypothetical protein